MKILAFDTCLTACSVAVLADDRVLASRAEPMARGHQERLAPLVQDLMGQAGLSFDQLDRIGVTVGPGSFTGLRVGLAFAKGLSAALDRPAIGIGLLEALAEGLSGRVAAVLDAKRDQVYLQTFVEGRPETSPRVLSLTEARTELAVFRPTSLVGTGGELMDLPDVTLIAADHADPVAIARLAARKPLAPPMPLYLRAPDARLPGQ